MCMDAVCTYILDMNGKNPCTVNIKGVYALKESSRSLHDGWGIVLPSLPSKHSAHSWMFHEYKPQLKVIRQTATPQLT